MTDLIIRQWNQKTIRQREDGYICLTDMCKAEGKLFGNWKENKDTKEFLKALSEDLEIPIKKLLIIVKGGYPQEQGTWGHPYIAMELGQWLSPKFSLFVNKWCIESLTDFFAFTEPAKTECAGFIYLIEAKDQSFYKIGKSKNVYERLHSLQTGSPFELIVRKRVFSTDCSKLENKLHNYYSNYCILGEWFNLPKEEITNFQNVALELDEEMESEMKQITQEDLE